jgi:hypothetical protein
LRLDLADCQRPPTPAARVRSRRAAAMPSSGVMREAILVAISLYSLIADPVAIDRQRGETCECHNRNMDP